MVALLASSMRSHTLVLVGRPWILVNRWFSRICCITAVSACRADVIFILLECCLLLDGTKRRFSFCFSQMRIFTHFCQKSDCFKYERSLKELPKCMTKSKRFSKLRWRADCIYFPIIDHPSLFSVMLNPYLLRGVTSKLVPVDSPLKSTLKSRKTLFLGSIFEPQVTFSS